MVFERSQIQGYVRTQPRRGPLETVEHVPPLLSLTSSRATPRTTSRISHISLPYSQYSAPPTAHLHTVHQCPSCLSPHFRHRVLLFLRMRQRRLSLCIHAPPARPSRACCHSSTGSLRASGTIYLADQGHSLGGGI